MSNEHTLATELIKATGVTLIDAEKFIVSHINVSKSQNFDDRPEDEKAKGDVWEDESVVIKVVLTKREVTRKK